MQGHVLCLPSSKLSGYTETMFITKEYDGHKGTNLEYSLVLYYPFSKIVVVSLSWAWPVSSSTISS